MKVLIKYFIVSIASFMVGAASVFLLFSLYVKTIDRNNYAADLSLLESLVVNSDKGRGCIGFDTVFNEYEKRIINGPLPTSTNPVVVFLGAYVGGADFVGQKEYQEHLRFLQRLTRSGENSREYSEPTAVNSSPPNHNDQPTQQ